ncbi:SYT11 protein, partial [Chionis minor]|nr:SYT11 protein [Chionis minor]
EEQDMMQKSSVVLDLHSLQMPFSNTWKYGILALVIFLLLVALTILTCQMCQLQKHNRTGKEKRCHSRGWVRIKAENGIWGKKMPPLLHDTAKQNNADIKASTLMLGRGQEPRTAAVSSVSGDLGLLPHSRGTLKFSLLYCREQCQLLLTGMEAWGLPNRGCAESAVRVRLLRHILSHIPALQCVVQERQSQVVQMWLMWIHLWHSSIVHLTHVDTLFPLLPQVQRFDKYSRNAVLGEVRVTLRDLKASQSLILCEELQKTTKDTVGEVLVSLKCLPISQRIEVGLLKAVTTSPQSTAEKNVYARIDVSCRCHRKKHQKSRPQAHTPLIIFNETFLFHMPEPLAWDCSVLVSIYEADSDFKHLIGQATLRKRGASEAADHWNLIIKSIQQPIAKWHPLLI